MAGRIFADTAFCMGSTRSQHQEQQDLKEASAHTMDFRRAVLQGDKELIDRFVSDMVPRLTEYLVITFGANLDLARECVQQSFVLVLERIVSRTLTDDTNVASYLMVIARNEYFACLKREQRNSSAVFQEMFYNEPADQLEALIEEDRQRILKLCLETLDERSRDLIGYMFKRPEASLVRISKVFGISPLNVRTRKSRIINRLADCYEKKSAE